MRASGIPNITRPCKLLQRFLQCCGVDGPDDYPTTKLPDSCCINGQCSTFEHRYHKDGCALKVYEFLRKSTNIVGGVAIGIAAIEIIGAVFGLCLASSIRNQYRRHIYA
ncbi:hypothetical protein NQ317_001307 [Molorchus minor]|uniref:Uncharacterized protein n=1 Tax=Molorchus minor TaxID=1323400 RepID=A0ABQ9IVF1_9CUCU|nr:hypothetical protein NQ317_001307 [Molorchus minor]